ncbi:hypothetical protein DBR32_12215 [Taibaiella sp. KBW10]|uniref:glycoside hydrolase family 10 protein n=1 Tax=Taibaiella sp. KBW10 TaxID=2153357 RepID=UPI000F5A7364|nr:family 10 glycosylhydrolase [Taibaiella sp. KBW10]RQO30329.1 hypothetical protein DBR32_12215 [Taibaiella sp. KBW10]
MLRYFYSTVLLFVTLFSFAQDAPKREFRAVWIATVGNIDWPSKPGLSAAQQQNEFIDRLTFLQENGFNAVIVQVRPSADAFYPSELEPWSKYLSGKQGVAPFPMYDPIAFMVTETHKRNMEFHAWFNPFRALVNSALNPNPPSHVTKQHPDWVINYGGKAYLDPGNPEARNYVNQVILDVVKRYDIDGVHIDDYFYPYKIAGKVFGDQRSFAQYGQGKSLDDWRRDNINKFVEALYKGVKKEKNYVKVGISPFGIWRNSRQDPAGSATNGTSCYDDLYADVLTWIQHKWVDYVAPQLYWEHGHRLAAYDVLVPWWKSVCKERALYIGMGVYRMVNATQATWQGSKEILKQIETERSYQAEGAIMYSMASFDKIGTALSKDLKQAKYYGTIAIPPTMPWIDNIPPGAPKATLKSSPNQRGAILTWEPTGNKEPVRYLVYKFDKTESIDLNKSIKIVAITQKNIFIDEDPDFANHKYIITAADRLWNESKPSEILVYR